MLVGAFVSLEPSCLIVIGLALALLWTVALRSQLSDAEPGWIERFGRALAVGWIFAITATNPVLLLVFSL